MFLFPVHPSFASVFKTPGPFQCCSSRAVRFAPVVVVVAAVVVVVVAAGGGGGGGGGGGVGVGVVYVAAVVVLRSFCRF